MSKEDHPSFFRTLPGILTGLASLIAAITGLYIALNNNGASVTSQRPDITDSASTGDSAAEHERKLEELRREKEIANLRLQQEREQLEAKRELENLRLETERQRALVAKEQEKSVAKKERVQALNVSGRWTLTNLMGTYTFVLHQDGGVITLEEYDPMGTMVGEGTGTIQNRLVTLNVTETMLYDIIQSRASLELSQDGQRLAGQISAQGASYQATLFRQ